MAHANPSLSNSATATTNAATITMPQPTRTPKPKVSGCKKMARHYWYSLAYLGEITTYPGNYVQVYVDMCFYHVNSTNNDIPVGIKLAADKQNPSWKKIRGLYDIDITLVNPAANASHVFLGNGGYNHSRNRDKWIAFPSMISGHNYACTGTCRLKFDMKVATTGWLNAPIKLTETLDVHMRPSS
jgi:hypothetical protein